MVQPQRAGSGVSGLALSPCTTIGQPCTTTMCQVLCFTLPTQSHFLPLSYQVSVVLSQKRFSYPPSLASMTHPHSCNHHLFKYFFCPIFSLHFLGLKLQAYYCLMLSHSSKKLGFVLFSFSSTSFSFCISVWMISVYPFQVHRFFSLAVPSCGKAC